MKEKALVDHPAFGDLSLYHFGIETCVPGHSWGPGLRDHFVVHAVLAGKGSFESGGLTRHPAAGWCFASFPDEICAYKADRHDPWEYAWIGFNGIRAAEYLERGRLSPAEPARALESAEAFHGLVARMFTAREAAAPDLVLAACLYEAVALLSGPRRRYGPSPGSSALEEAVRYIGRRISLPLGVEELSERIGIHRSQLYRLFKEGCGISPHRYIESVKMERAKELLADGRLSVRGVGESVGYPDQLEFSRAFRRYAGVPPSAWRTGAPGHAP